MGCNARETNKNKQGEHNPGTSDSIKGTAVWLFKCVFDSAEVKDSVLIIEDS
jgi:hypothetical protein